MFFTPRQILIKSSHENKRIEKTLAFILKEERAVSGEGKSREIFPLRKVGITEEPATWSQVCDQTTEE